MNGTSRGMTRRTLAALAMLILGLGTALIGVASTAGSANAAPKEKVGVCHRTASDTNPYVYISVPVDEANGHITGEAKNHKSPRLWKADGTWRGESHVAGEEKWDYMAPGGPADCQDSQPGDGDGEGPSYCPSDAPTNAGSPIPDGQTEDDYCTVEEELCPDGSAFPTEDVDGSGTIDEADCDEFLGSESSRPEGDGDGDGDGDVAGDGDGDAEVLGIEAEAPAAAPTAVDAGMTAEETGTNSSLWLLAGAALALGGAMLGFTPARARGKRVR